MKEANVKINTKYSGSSVDDFFNEIYTADELEIIKERADFLLQIVEARKAVNLTQIDLSKKTGISQSTIAKIENGKINPSLNNIFKILHAMGKTIKIENRHRYDAGFWLEGERFMDVSNLLLGYFIVLSGCLRGYLSSL